MLLKSEMKTDVIEKLKVDQEDALSDAFAYYKRPSYDSIVPLQIKYRGQPAVDTGGVLRQFCTDVFPAQMLQGADGLPPLFEGNENRKLPFYNSGIAVSDVMKLIGKIFSHSIVKVGLSCSSNVSLYLLRRF